MKQFKVLVVDDEQGIVDFVRMKLKASGYEVITAKSGYEALEQVKTHNPDLIVMDVVMPGMNGLEALKGIRTFSSIPVIMLSAKGDPADRIKGLGSGADDYLPKPFSPDELVARIEAVRRRISASELEKPLGKLVLNHLIIDLHSHKATVHGKEIKLTKIEWSLLNTMALHQGKVMLYQDLLSQVWGPQYREDIWILRSWMSRLRKKIENDLNGHRIINTVPKIGYIINK